MRVGDVVCLNSHPTQLGTVCELSKGKKKAKIAFVKDNGEWDTVWFLPIACLSRTASPVVMNRGIDEAFESMKMENLK